MTDDDTTRRTASRSYHLHLHTLVPLIFAGLVLLAFLLAHWLAGGHAAVGAALGWGLLLAAGAFAVGAFILRLMLQPMERFVRQAEQLPIMRATPEPDDPMPKRADEMARYSEVFRRLTHILSKVEADELFPAIVGQSRAMRGLMAQVLKVADTDAAVCILGESGTGKELVAQNIHDHSARSGRPLVKINCAAIPDSLLESELFGHEKGAFTGAAARKPGKFELAQGGTVLLDEIGDMPLALQGKLLRAIEEKEFERLGGTTPIRADVRFVTATNRDLEDMVTAGTFRNDLYYRITAATLRLPPLRERLEDVPLLVRDFLIRQAGDGAPPSVTTEAMDLLMAHSWPGNVRELHNILGQALLACEGGPIRPAHLPLAPSVMDADTPTSPPQGFLAHEADLDAHLAAEEKRLILLALHRCGGVQARAAEMLGIKPRSLWHRIKKHDIDPGVFKASKNGE